MTAETAQAYAHAAKALLAAARRALDRGDAVELDRLLDEAEEELRRMVEAMPRPFYER